MLTGTAHYDHESATQLRPAEGSDMRWSQARVAAVLLVTAAATIVSVDAIARSHWLESRILAYDQARARSGADHMPDAGITLEFEDRLLLEDLPQADYRRGGVYIFGNSTAKWAFKAWELQPELKGLIHNYGIGATGYRLQYQFMRHLVEDDGFLTAPEKTHVIVAAHWSLSSRWPPVAYFGPLWQRHGFYRYDENTGIHPVKLSATKGFVRRERARCAGLLGGMVERLWRLAFLRVHVPPAGTYGLGDPAIIDAIAKRVANEPDWRNEYELQVAQFDELVRYVRGHNAGISIVLLPSRQVFDSLEHPLLYRQELEEYCAKHVIPFLDLSDLLAEDEFWDVNHPNCRGLAKTHDHLLAEAVARLRAMGVISDVPGT